MDTAILGKGVARFGDVGIAQHIITFVPGACASYDSEAPRAELMGQLAGSRERGPAASVLWLGYVPPPHARDGISKRRAMDAAGELAGFVSSLRETGAHLTVISHSYGSLVSGLAASEHGMRPDDLVFVGSPGTGVRSASKLNMADGHVWAGASAQDPVARLAHVLARDFGGSPVAPEFGAQVFGADFPQVFPGRMHQGAHFAYWDSGTESLANFLSIATADYARVTRPHHPEA